MQCSEKKENNLIVLDPIEFDRKIDILSYVSDIEYIFFEETPNTLLNHIVDLAITDSYFILRCHQRSNLFYFTKNGEYAKSFRKIGNGPLEISSMTDMTSEHESDEVYILDNIKNKILKYNITNDSIDSYFQLKDGTIFSILFSNGKIFSTSTHEDGYLKVSNFDDKEVIFSLCPKNESIINFIVTQNNMFEYQETIYYNPSFHDTIYASDGNTIWPKFVLGINEKNIQSIDKLQLMQGVLDNDLMDKVAEKALIPRGFLSIYKDLFFIERVNGYKMTVFNHKNSESFNVDFRNFINREFLFEYQLFKLLTVYDGYAYSYIFLDADNITTAENLTEENSFNESVNKALLNIINKYNSSDLTFENPILVKFKLDDSFNTLFSN